jgi:RNA polymerase sigma-70 factor, ECF subfamily
MLAFVQLPTAPPATVAGRRVSCRIFRGGHNLHYRFALSLLLDENTRNLISRALGNDRDAVDALFQRYRDRLRQALRKLVGPKYRLVLADSEDATHDAILSALRRLNQFEYRGDGSFLAWLLKGAEFEIVRRVRAIEAQKRSAQQANVELDTQLVRVLPGKDPSPSDIVDEQEMAERVRQALGQLPDREREVIVLRRYLELDTEEICEEMGLPTAGSVRALLSRAQARLSGLLSRDQDE